MSFVITFSHFLTVAIIEDGSLVLLDRSIGDNLRIRIHLCLEMEQNKVSFYSNETMPIRLGNLNSCARLG